jgi:cytochrome c oxidase cbb3-type subunit 1
LLVLFISAAVWLVIGSVFALISSIKFHQPSFLASCSCLTYGRVHPAYLNALLFGFCVQAGLGFTLWQFVRLGRTPLAQPWLVTLGGALWNLGVTVGVAGILAGDGTGFEYLEMPQYAALLTFLGYLILGVPAIMTFHQRRERQLFVSQWFLLAALFWFPWIYSTAYLLLVRYPVRGVAQAAIAFWYADNFLGVWMALIGLGAGFYLIPKLTKRDLHNHYLAVFAFWTLILFTSWAGIPKTTPLPAWLPTISVIATALTVLPLFAVALNFHQTLANSYRSLFSNPSLLFTGFAVAAFVLAGFMKVFSTFVDIGHQLEFTWFCPAQAHLNFYGFFAMAMFGAIYYLLPQVAGLDFPSPKLVRTHFWLAAVGIVLLVLPLAIGGIIQAFQLQNSNIPFMEIAGSTLLFLRISTVGDLLLLVGHLLFLGNSIGLGVRVYRAQAMAAYSEVTADLFKAAEVKP